MNWWRTGSVYSSVCVLCILFEIEKSSVYPLIYAFSLNENENSFGKQYDAERQ